MTERDEPNGRVPEQGADPIVWDPVQRRFVPESERAESAGGAPSPLPAAPPARGIAAPRGPDQRRFRVPARAVGVALPPQPGTPPGPPSAPAAAGGGARRAAPAQVVVPAPDAAQAAAAAAGPGTAPPGVRAPLPLPRNAPSPSPAAAPAGRDRTRKRNGKRKRLLPNRPKLRRVVLLLPVLIPLLVVLLVAGGLWYANSKFHELHRVPVGNVLDAEHGATNILLVGSDTRDLQGVSSDASGIFGDATNAAPTGQRSDTIMVLRLDGSGAHTLSIPRDLIVTLAGTGKRDRINAAYNTDLGGGPVRLIQTVKDTLKIPITRYMEVDFGTFAGVVDAVGGIDIDFPNPAFDDNTGLNITEAGTHHLNGEQALEYVRSRHYTEIINGKHVEDPTADLGRIKRQQAFLTAVFHEVGGSKNPFTLLKVGGEMVKGLRVDDKLGFFDALRLGWDLKGLHPQSVELPVAPNADNATLHLRDDVDTALVQFR